MGPNQHSEEFWCKLIAQSREDAEMCANHLLKLDAELFKARDKSNLLPLHAAILARAPFTILKAILARYPQAMFEKVPVVVDTEIKKLTALHLLWRIQGESSDQLTRMIINIALHWMRLSRSDAQEEEPSYSGLSASQLAELMPLCAQALGTPDEEGMLLLHYALCLDPGFDRDYALVVEVVKASLLVHPECVMASDNNLENPLHFAVRDVDEHRLVIINHILELGGDFAGTAINSQNERHKTPLHIAAEEARDDDGSTGLQLIQRLVETSPGPLTLFDENGASPLQAAVMSESPSAPVIRYLVKTTMRMNNGAKIVGRALWKFCTENFTPEQKLEAIELLAVSPEVVSARDELGRTWLHCVAVRGQLTEEEPFKIIVERFPEVLTLTDSQGRSPLHVAVIGSINATSEQEHEGYDRTVKILLTNPPGSIKSLDNFGRTPLSYASLLRGVPIQIIYRLLHSDPAETLELLGIADSVDEAGSRMDVSPSYASDYSSEAQSTRRSSLKRSSDDSDSDESSVASVCKKLRRL